jgi:ATP-dependent DNA helicase DinG
VRMRLRSTLAWLEQVNLAVGTLAQRVGRPGELMAAIEAIAALTAAAAPAISELLAQLADLDFVSRDESRSLHRFPLGRIPDAIGEVAAAAAADFQRLATHVEHVHGLLQEVVDGNRSWANGHEAEDWLGVVGQHVSRAAGAWALLNDYASGSRDESTRARWVVRIAFDAGDDLELVAAPMQPGALLEEALWSQAFAVINTSATLTALGRFERFIERTGLDESALQLRIASPFDFPSIATFTVPAMRSDPRDAQAHTEEVAALLPDLLVKECSALVLFASWRQLNDVVGRLPAALVSACKVQGSGSKQALLAAHRADIDAGRPSYVVGVASFAEGVDLPDDYCRHVIIAKLPFAVPDDPLDEAMAEWLTAQGRNPFFEISLPDASLRLVQACGRLIRHEGDWGRITLLDRRIVTQRYGKRLLEALPAYRRVLEAS